MKRQWAKFFRTNKSILLSIGSVSMVIISMKLHSGTTPPSPLGLFAQSESNKRHFNEQNLFITKIRIAFHFCQTSKSLNFSTTVNWHILYGLGLNETVSWVVGKGGMSIAWCRCKRKNRGLHLQTKEEEIKSSFRRGSEGHMPGGAQF